MAMKSRVVFGLGTALGVRINAEEKEEDSTKTEAFVKARTPIAMIGFQANVKKLVV